MDDSSCTPNAFEAVITTLSFFSLCVSWWLVDVPLLFVKPPRRSSDGDASSSPGRVRLFFRAVAWNCIRAVQPTYIGLIALARAISDGRNSTSAWPLLYYFGDALPNHPQVLRPTALQWVKVALLDGVILVTEILLVVYGYTAGRYHDTRVFAAGMWILSATPACVLGAYLLLFVSRRVSRLHRSWRLATAGSLLVLVGLALILSLYFSAPRDRVPAIASIMTMQWVLPLLPMVACQCTCCGLSRGMPWRIVYLIFAVAVRTITLTLDVGSSTFSNEFWFCRVPPQAGGWVTGVFGGALLFGFAIKGVVDAERWRPELVKVWKGQQQGALSTETYVPLQDDEERQNEPPRPPQSPPPPFTPQPQQQQQGEDHGESDMLQAEGIERRSTDLPSYQDATRRTDTMPPSYGEAAPDGQLVFD
ncbi:hypothetical protein PLIIFM63780_007929 [Purpureocillium lilacinum]|uniref:Uncharacterized protein n=1 Tax=Purpureocillium lilacinum TaxID=33203 RepID=A0A179GP65_PURLI|nr:hypothetical protein VFPBJ_05147 [Purpureocillium lilacinum]PWI73518.1 hypothetical protein PCL_08794 [Purpureocillium lilacinum]GJN73858.1 hypothetical protein PLICBS_007941 [Purpureocillium lilacinum]GJN84373.1 hypothetical protein PLIIFM63780_007929 [Purpureocillium lilacinum]